MRSTYAGRDPHLNKVINVSPFFFSQNETFSSFLVSVLKNAYVNATPKTAFLQKNIGIEIEVNSTYILYNVANFQSLEKGPWFTGMGTAVTQESYNHNLSDTFK